MWQTFPYVVTVHTASIGADEYGNLGPTAWTSATARGDIQPNGSTEDNSGTAGTDSNEVRFFLAPGTAVTSADKLTVTGGGYTEADEFEVVAPPDVRDTGSPLDYVRVRARLTS